MAAYHRGMLKYRTHFSRNIPFPLNRTITSMKSTFSHHSFWNFFFLLMLFGISGCMGNSGEPLPDLGKVTGVVTMDGSPVINAKVIFEPTKAMENGRKRASMGTTQADGSYSLKYNANTPGASVGKHKVMIIKLNDNPAEAGQQLIPPQYNDNSELTAEVTQGENKFDFELKSK